jgi:hypothetical protein
VRARHPATAAKRSIDRGNAMRFAADWAGWDRLMPAFVLPYAAWTLYVHGIVAARASFGTLLLGLPLLAVVAVAATVKVSLSSWMRSLFPPMAPLVFV